MLGSHGPDLWSFICPKCQCGENMSRKMGHQEQEERNRCHKYYMRKENVPIEGPTLSAKALFSRELGHDDLHQNYIPSG